MGVTVGVNHLSVVHKSSEGVTLAFPTVCKTPGVALSDPATPIPYPAVATKARKVQAEKKIKTTKMAPPSRSPMVSGGNEPGTLKGMVNHQQVGKTPWMMGSSKVKAQSKGLVPGLDMMTHNAGAGQLHAGVGREQAEHAREQARAAAEAASLRSRLGALAQRIQSMDSPDPNEWQKALEEYLVAAGALYVTLHG